MSHFQHKQAEKRKKLPFLLNFEENFRFFQVVHLATPIGRNGSTAILNFHFCRNRTHLKKLSLKTLLIAIMNAVQVRKRCFSRNCIAQLQKCMCIDDVIVKLILTAKNRQINKNFIIIRVFSVGFLVFCC